MKCLVCEKELKTWHELVVDAGSMILNFGYGSRFDQPNNFKCYICDDCYEKKKSLIEDAGT